MLLEGACGQPLKQGIEHANHLRRRDPGMLRVGGNVVAVALVAFKTAQVARNQGERIVAAVVPAQGIPQHHALVRHRVAHQTAVQASLRNGPY